MEFLSTPSARRATQCGQLRHQLLQDFYPRPPRGGRRLAKIIGHALNAISIHALREEGDGLLYDYYTLADLFLSTPSARRATRCLLGATPRYAISIHALREEGDFWMLEHRIQQREFLSTPSARRATHHCPERSARRRISIHALREEGDFRDSRNGAGCKNFYPRPPRGGRRGGP